jgi:hypothetical protein
MVMSQNCGSRPGADFCLSVLMSRKPDILAMAKARFA